MRSVVCRVENQCLSAGQLTLGVLPGEVGIYIPGKRPLESHQRINILDLQYRVAAVSLF